MCSPRGPHKDAAVAGAGSVPRVGCFSLANGLRHPETRSGVNHDDGGYAHLAVVFPGSGLRPAAWQLLSHNAAPSAAGRAGLRPRASKHTWKTPCFRCCAHPPLETQTQGQRCSSPAAARVTMRGYQVRPAPAFAGAAANGCQGTVVRHGFRTLLAGEAEPGRSGAAIGCRGGATHGAAAGSRVRAAARAHALSLRPELWERRRAAWRALVRVRRARAAGAKADFS